MERLDPRARSDIYGKRINRAPYAWRVRSVPYVTIMLGSLLPVLLIADLMPLFPSLGFLMLLGWRMVRPGLLPLWAGAPLGAFDDLVSGQPFGSAILLWSLAMIVIELIETRFPWRGFWTPCRAFASLTGRTRARAPASGAWPAGHWEASQASSQEGLPENGLSIRGSGSRKRPPRPR